MAKKTVKKSISIKKILTQMQSSPGVPIGFIGNPGSGKSYVVEDFCKSNNIPYVVLLAATMDEVDISGIITVSADRTSAVTLSPSWSKLVCGYPSIESIPEHLKVDANGVARSDKYIENLCNGRCCIFIDELTCGRREVQDTLLTLIQSRHFPNGDPISKNCMIVTAINDATQVGGYHLSPAMKNRFGWFTVETTPKQWVAWAVAALDNMTQQQPANARKYEDVKLFLTELLTTSFKFSEYDDFLDDEQTLFTTPRSMWNLLTFSNFELSAVMTYVSHFVSFDTVTAIRSISQTAIKDRSNAVLERYRAEIQTNSDYQPILNASDSVTNVSQFDEPRRSVPF
jgi:hypothetical protein